MPHALKLAAATLLAVCLHAPAGAQPAAATDAPRQPQTASNDVERESPPPGNADPGVASRLEARGTPFSVDDDGDYRILVELEGQRSQIVWVRSVVNETDYQRVREIWTYGMRSEERRIPVHVANRLLTENFELVVGAWARDAGNAILVLKIDADADADTLDEAIDLAASIGDRMEQRLVVGDDL